MFDLLERLCALPGVSGDEQPVADAILKEISSYAECRFDNLGNLIAFKKGKEPAKTRLMVCAHMDEVGLMVTTINDSGMLKFGAVGGIDPRVILGRRVKVGKNEVIGVIGTKAVHLQDSDERSTSPAIDKLYIDIGAKNKEDALKVVNPGDTAVFDSDSVSFGENMLKARALDDRMGCALMIELIKSGLPYDCTFVFTVQEEVGTRGAGVAAYGVNPDAAIIIETTTAADIAFVEDDKKVCYLGKGPVISFMDRRTIYNRDLYNLAFAIAAEKKIACQPKLAVAGGNDAGAVHISRAGVKSLAVSLPCRYLHSPSCVINKNDASETLRLLKELCSVIPERDPHS